METFELDSRFSTTRRLTRAQSHVNNESYVGCGSPPLFAAKNHPCHGGLRTQGYYKPSKVDKPLITVITAVFNGLSELEATLNSVLGQRYDAVEYIVVDGGSQDGTVEILRRYDDRIDYWFSEPDKGISDAWNKAIALASGEYISFLNAGDEYLEGALSSVAKRIPPFEFSWGDMLWIAESGEATPYQGRDSYREVIEYVMPFNHPTMFFQRASVLRVNGYSTICRFAMDYDLVRKIVRAGGNGVYVPFTIAKMKAGGIHDRNYSDTVSEVKKIAVSHGTKPLFALFAERYTLLKHGGDNSILGYMLGRLIAVAKRMRRWLQRIF